MRDDGGEAEGAKGREGERDWICDSGTAEELMQSARLLSDEFLPPSREDPQREGGTVEDFDEATVLTSHSRSSMIPQYTRHARERFFSGNTAKAKEQSTVVEEVSITPSMEQLLDELYTHPPQHRPPANADAGVRVGHQLLSPSVAENKFHHAGVPTGNHARHRVPLAAMSAADAPRWSHEATSLHQEAAGTLRWPPRQTSTSSEGENLDTYGIGTAAPQSFTEYLSRVSCAEPPALQRELTAMGDAWGAPDPQPDEIVLDCLVLAILLNKTSAVRSIVVPLLGAQLQSRLRLLQALSRKTVDGAGADMCPGSEEFASSTADLLCAIAGLGHRAACLLPPLLDLFWSLPADSSMLCDVRLVCLAIRCVGGGKGLSFFIRIVADRSAPPHVLAAAVYGLAVFSYTLFGSTKVLCAPPGSLQRDRGGPLHCIVREATASPSISTAEALGPLLGEAIDAEITAASSLATAPPMTAKPYIMAPPPYAATHIIIDGEAARQELLRFLASESLDATGNEGALPLLLLLKNVDATLLRPALVPSAVREYQLGWGQAHRKLRELEDAYLLSADTALACLAPPLPYAYDPHFSSEADTLFTVEAALIKLLLHSTTPLVQEQVLAAVATLPPVVRQHVAQPIVDFLQELLRSFAARWASTMRRSSNNDIETQQEAVLVAACLATGTVLVNAFAPPEVEAIAVVVPMLMELLNSPRTRVRHAACLALSLLGPYTPDPGAIVDLQVALLQRSRAAPVPEGGGVASDPGSGMDLSIQPASIIWALVQQGEGGVRALLRVLQDPKWGEEVHVSCAWQLAQVDVYQSCGVSPSASAASAADATALLDEMIQVLGRLIAVQGALGEVAVLHCVRALAELVHATTSSSRRQAMKTRLTGTMATTASDAAIDAALSDHISRHRRLPEEEEEASAYYSTTEEPNDCYTVLCSIIEAALVPSNVLKGLFFYLCAYGGVEGELYTCRALFEGSRVGSRAAAAYGLRACGAKVIRSLVLGMNDSSFEVRRESFDTLEKIGADAVVQVFRRRSPQQRHQVVEALRDCLLRDAGRGVCRQAAEQIYDRLHQSE